MKKLMALAICCASLTALTIGVKADSYSDRYSSVASWSNLAGYTAKYDGTARFNDTTGKYYSNATMKHYSGLATVTPSGYTNNGTYVVIRANIAAPNDYTNGVTRTVYNTSSKVQP